MSPNPKLLLNAFLCLMMCSLFTQSYAQSSFIETQKIVASDRISSDNFASVSMHGNWILAGVNLQDYDTVGANFVSDAGAAYFFEYTGGSYVERQKITSPSRDSSDYFGLSVSVFGDYAAVGAYLEDYDSVNANFLNDAGAVFIYKLNLSGRWEHVQTLQASTRRSGDEFGYSLSISDSILVVSARQDDYDSSGANFIPNTGSAYVFKLQLTGRWEEVDKISAHDRASFDWFGQSVDVHGDYIIVGAINEDEDASGANTLTSAGSAYIFEKGSGNTWSQKEKIVATHRGFADFFGNSVAINGNQAVVSSFNDDLDASGLNSLSSAGAAYVFERGVGGSWTIQQKLVASDRAISDLFGRSVDILSSRILVGADLEDEDIDGLNTLSGAGSAYIFEENAGVWSEEHKIVSSDRDVGDYFGFWTALSDSKLVVSSIWEDHDEGGSNFLNASGSAYIFELCATTRDSIEPEICSGDTFYSPGGDTLTMAGTYYDTIPNADGCDSVIYIDLTINSATFSTINVSECGSYTSPSRKIYTTSNTYLDTIPNAANCDSVITINLTILGNSGSFGEIVKLVASDRGAVDVFGHSVSISGDQAIVGAYGEDEDSSGANTLSFAGSAYIFEKDLNDNWVEVQKLVASDRGVDDLFGWSVSISGDYAIVGAYFEDEDSSGANTLSAAGSAYIFEKDVNGNWVEVEKLVASDRGASDYFGYAVSISGDQAIVGAYFEDEDSSGANTLSSAGSAYIFEKDLNGNWVEVQKLVASDRAPSDYLGWSVSISGDQVIVGARSEDEDTAGANTLSAAGSAYIFEKDVNDNWVEVEKLIASDRGVNDQFGYAVSISGDKAIVGAYFEDEDTLGANTLSDAGSAYVFEKDVNGNWPEVQKLVASDRGASDAFGWSVSISGDKAIIGAYAEDEDTLGANTLSFAGSAYRFEKDLNGNWVESKKLVASDRGADDQFGYSVSISGEQAIVGSRFEDEDASGSNTLVTAGSAYIFGLVPDSLHASDTILGLDTICANSTVTYTADTINGAIGYLWTLPTGWSGFSDSNSITVTSNSTGGDIQVQGYDNCDTSEVTTLSIAIRMTDDGIPCTHDSCDATTGLAIHTPDNSICDDGDQCNGLETCDPLLGCVSGTPPGTFKERLKVNGFDREVLDNFGHSVSISGDQAIIGQLDLNGLGLAYIYEKDINDDWVYVQKLTASDSTAGDSFGWSVSISGDQAIVGAINEDEDTSGANTLSAAGSAYIFEKNGLGSWVEVNKLVASDRGVSDNFGYSVSISGDQAVVSAIYEDEDTSNANTLSASGSAYVFEKDGNGNWVEVNKLVASDRGIDDNFGNSVSINGNQAIISAWFEDEDTSGANTLSSAGSAYIFEKDGNGNWIEVQKLVSSDRAVDDLFGVSVSISGENALIGAYGEDEDTSGSNTIINAGSGYIFKRTDNGKWVQSQKLIASNRLATEGFGGSVSISGDNAIIGTQFGYSDVSGGNFLFDAGTAYIFKKDTNDNYVQTQQIVASDREANDWFGYSVSISGENAIVGAHQEDEDTAGANSFNDAGSAYFFGLVPDTLTPADSIVGPDTVCTNDLVTYSIDSIEDADGYIWTLPSGWTGSSDSISITITASSTSGDIQVQGYNDCDTSEATILSITVNDTSHSTIDTTICSGSYTSPSGEVFTVSNTYLDTIPNAVNCDSIITINLTVNQTTRDTIYPVVCDTFITAGNDTLTMTGMYYDTIPNSQNCDSIILIDLTITPDTRDTVYPTTCDSFIAPSGQVYSSTGMFYDTIPNANNCDSIILIDLTILQDSRDTIYPIVCDSFVTPSGSVLNSTGMFYDTIPNNATCDSIILIDLTLAPNTRDTLNPSVCDTFITPGNDTLTMTGIYYDTIPNSQNCDSVILINLTVTSVTRDTINPTVCDTFITAGGDTLTMTGMYYDTIPNAQNCDSVILIDLMVISATRDTIYPNVCDTFVSPGNDTLTSTGIYYDTIPNANNCDSVIYIDLTINSATFSTINVSECGSYTSPSGKIYTTSNTYLDTIPNTANCDSVITINLTILGKSGNFNEIIKLVASDRGAVDLFGNSVSISGDHAIVGAYADDEDTSGTNTLSSAGSAYIFEKDGNGNWVESQKLVASDRDASDNFGIAVSISGDQAIVGAFLEDEDTSGTNTLSSAGSAYIFEKDINGNWIEVNKLVASDRGANDNFGYSVSISGNQVIVGARQEDEDTSGANTLSSAGSAYIFEKDINGNWVESEKLVASDRGSFDFLGYSVSISGDRAIVGAYAEDEDTSGGNSLLGSGSAYIFEKDLNGNWVEINKLVALDRALNDFFGYSVDISGDVAIVGAINEDEDTSGSNTINQAGSAYVFERDLNGNWVEINKLVASDRATTDNFGHAVSISGDKAIVGAYQEDEDTSGLNTLSAAGSAYLFEKDLNGNWVEVKKLVSSDRAAIDNFGWSVSISGEQAIIGAYQEDEDASGGNTLNESGSAYIFGLVPDSLHASDTILGLDTICANSTVTYIADTINGATGYLWTLPAGWTGSSDSNSITIIANSTSGDIQVQGYDNCDTSDATILSITVNDTSHFTIDTTVCQSYTSPGGVVYTTSNTYMDTIPNAVNCDSIITINLTVNQTTRDTIYPIVCDTFITAGNDTLTITGIYSDTIPNANNCDSIILIDLTVTPLTRDTLNPTVCDTFITPGNDTLTMTGIYYDTIPNSQNCDSVILINLTVTSVTRDTINPTVCDTFITVGGDTLTMTGMYYDTIPNAQNCDSVILIDLMVISATRDTIYPNVCDTFISPGNDTLTMSGIYYDTIPNANNCDSIILIDLTVGEPTRDTINPIACDTFVSPGNDTLTMTGTYNDTIPNSQNCDSVILINLTIAPDTRDTIYPSVCDSFVTPSGTVYNITGMYFDTIPNANNCDSIILIDLTILQDSRDTIYPVTCDSFVAPSGTVYNMTGMYFDTISNNASCDSIILIDLTVSSVTRDTVYPNVCDTFVSPGNDTLTMTGMYYDTIPNANNCDSIILIDLTVGEPSRDTITPVTCDTFISPGGDTLTSTGITYDTLMNADGCDSIIQIDLTVNSATSSTINPIECLSYTSPSGKVFTSSNTYMDTIPNANSCDSIITINLTINDSSSSTIDTTVCETYTSPSGKVFNSSNTYLDTILNANNCDSIITIDLTVNASSSSSLSPSVCDSFVAPSGAVYYASNTFNDTIGNTVGCDSVITINLTVNSNSSSSTSPIACDSFVSPAGDVYYSSTTFNDTIPNAVGCDSVITINLTVDSSTSSVIDTSACLTYTSPSGKVFNASNTYLDTIPNAVGCDSTITINLTILTNSTFAINPVACDEYISPSGQTYTSTSLFFDTIPNAVGCDSVIVVNLTINNSDTITINPVACDSFLSPAGNMYYMDSTFNDTLLNADGCDSIITVNLIVNYTSRSSIMDTACDQYTAPSGATYASTGTYSDTILNVSNCDSIITIDLTIKNSTTFTFDTISCDSFIAPSGATYYSSGTFNDTIANAVGCDSVITMNVTIGTLTSSFVIDTGCFTYTSPSGQTWDTTGIYFDTIPNALGCDSAITVDLLIATSTINIISRTACDSFISPSGKVFFVTDIYLDTINNALGCDSIMSIILTINNSTNPVLNITACNFYTSPSGKIFDTAGTYYDTALNAQNCNAYYTINLSIDTNTYGALTDTACDVYIAPSGKSITTTGIHLDTIPNADNCDSIITIDLLIYNSTSSTIDTSVCAVYNSPAGNLYNANGAYSDTLVNSNGCDSVITINLTLLKSFDTIDTTVCDIFVAPSGQSVSASGSFLDTITNSVSCDSIITINLTIISTTTATINPVACDSFVSPAGDVYYSSAIFDDTLVNNVGCDSIITVNLTLNESTFDTINPVACDSFVSPAGDVYTTSINFIDTIGNAVGCDSFITVNLTINLSTDTSIIVIACDSFVTPSGLVVFSSDTINDTILNSVGCDSVITIDVTINQSTTSSINPVVCDSFVSPTGDIYYSSTIFNDTIGNAVGCDSIITVNLTINLSTRDTLNPIVCDSFVSTLGDVYYVSTMFNDTIINAIGCDSVITVNLIVNQSSFDTIDPVVCDSFITPGGVVLYASDTLNDTILNIAGCDSVITINLVVNLSTNTTINPVACDSFVSPAGDVYYASQNFSDTLVNSSGCDSIITVNLTIDSTTYDTLNPVVCDSFTSPAGMVYYSSGIFTDTLVNASGCDSLILVDLTVNYTSFSTINPIACDSYLSPSGNTYTASGTYSDTIPNVSGCDSIITVLLVIDSSTFNTTNETVCDSFVSSNGTVYYSSTILNDTLINAVGCDSVITVNLTVNYTTRDTVSPIACDSFVTPSGLVLFASDTLNDTIVNASGCDSIVTINLTLNQSSTSSINPIACDSFITPSGMVLYVTDTLNDTILNISGCDSVITINLVVNYSTNSVINPVACDSFVSPAGDVYYTSTVISDTLVNVSGCDSIVTVNLTVNYSSRDTVSPIACDSFVTPSGLVLFASDTLNDTIVNASGCDSIVTINLTLNQSSTSSISPIACDSFITPSGMVLYVTDTLNDTILNISGCDSVITINLVVNYSTNSVINPVACDSFVSPAGDVYYTSTVISDTLVNVSGCDSIVTVNLTVNLTSTSTQAVTVCDSFIAPSGAVFYMSDTITDTLVNAAGCDSILTINLTIDTATTSILNPVVCDSFIAPSGQIYYASTQFNDTLTNNAGCDSIITYDVTVNPKTFATVFEQACETYLSPAGNTYSTTGTYQDTIANALGCDSIITIFLTIDTNTFSTTTENACDSFVSSNGTVYYASTMLTDTFANAAGCDSIVTVNLTIFNSSVLTLNPVVCGSYTSPAGNVYDSTGTYIDTITNAANCDSIITINLTINENSFDTIIAIVCDSFISPSGVVYNSTGTYFDTLTNAGGCDSLINIDLTVVGATTSSLVVNACDSYTSPSGNNYTTSGIYSDTILNSAGCDSIIGISLTIDTSSTSTINPVVCDSFTAPSGTVYFASANFNDTILNNGGCDSVITINLTVGTSTASTINPVVCDNYISPAGNAYLVSGTYSDTIPNANGCDSVITINLTLNNSTSAVIAPVACDSFISPSGDVYYTSATFNDTILNVGGCDSVIAITLTVNNSSATSISYTACDTFTFNGTTYSSTGTYIDTLTNSQGCDSLVSLNLTILNSTSVTINPLACISYLSPAGNTYSTSGTYFDTIINAAGCDSAITINLTVNDTSSSVIWDTGCGVYITPAGNAITSSGQYFDTITNAGGCDSFITLNILIIDVIADFFTNPVCSGDSTVFQNLSSAINGASYFWDFDSDGIDDDFTVGNTKYLYPSFGIDSATLIVEDANGCRDTVKRAVAVDTTPVANVGLPIICETNVITLADSSLYTGGIVSYQWDVDGDGIDDINSGAGDQVWSYSTPGPYAIQLIVTKGNGCADTFNQNFTVDSLPAVVFLGSVECFGDSTEFTDFSLYVGDSATYQWDFTNDGIIDDTSTTTPIYDLLPLGLTTAKLIITNAWGCVDSGFLITRVDSLPLPLFSTDTVCEGQITSFTETSQITGPGSIFYWDFENDGTVNDSSVGNIQYMYDSAGVYTANLQIVNTYGCINDTSFTVIVDTTPILNVTADTVCERNPTTFTNLTQFEGSGASYSIDLEGDGVVDTIMSDSLSPVIYPGWGSYSTTIFVQKSAPTFCLDSIVISVEVLNSPEVGFFTQQACAGKNIDFIDTTSDAGLNPVYSWDFENDGIEDDTTIGNTVSIYANPGFYTATLIVVSDNGCSDTVSNSVFVDTVPVPDFTSDTVCFGQATSFFDSSSLAGTGAIYHWDFNGDGLRDDTTTGNTSWILPSSGNNPVQLSIIKANGCRDTIVLNAYTEMTPQIDVVADTVCDGDVTTYTDNTTMTTGSVTYQWDFTSDSIIDDATVGNNTNTFQPLGFYTTTLVVINATGCADTALIPVRIDTLPLVSFTNDSVCINEAISFTDLSLITGPGSTYNWDFDLNGTVDNNIVGNTSNTYGAPGTYFVELEVINQYGCVGYDTGVAVVHDLPVVNFVVSSACPSDTAFFVDQSLNADTGSIYYWDFENDGIIDDTGFGDNFFMYPGVGGTQYTAKLIIVNEFGCIDSNFRTFVLSPLPQPGFIADRVCQNELTSFTDLSVSDPGSTYQWDFENDGVVDNTIPGNVQYTYATHGLFDAQLTITTPDGCVDSFNQVVQVDSIALPSFTVNEVCHWDTTRFIDMSDQVSPNSDYFWDFDGDGVFDNITKGNVNFVYPLPGTFNAQLMIRNSNGCENSFTLAVTVHPNPVVIIAPENACDGDAITVVNSSIFEAGSGHQWDVDVDGTVDGTTTGDFSTILTPPGLYTIELLIVSPFGCRDSNTVQVEVYPNPVVTLDGLDPEYCINDPFDILTFSPDGGTLSGPGANGAQFIPSLAGLGPASLTYFYVDANGCTGSATQSTVVYDEPVIDAGEDQTIDLFQTAQLLASGGVSYIWTPPTYLNDHLIENPVSSPNQTIQYIVTGTDENSCSSIDTVVIMVNPDIPVFVPTGFSPNGDGFNDYLKPLNDDFEYMLFQVFNRWGELVYETNSLNTGWDGEFNGRPQEIGVFTWKLEYRFPGQLNSNVISGNATLIR